LYDNLKTIGEILEDIKPLLVASYLLIFEPHLY